MNLSARGLGGVLVMGLIQGLTEFLPVSSSGHLVLGSTLLHLTPPSLLLDIVLHFGTTLAIVGFYRAEIASILRSLLPVSNLPARYSDDPNLRMALCIVVGSIPTALIGFSLKDHFLRLFSDPVAVGVALILTGLLLLLTKWFGRGADSPGRSQQGFRSLTPFRSLVIGIAQGAALTPGISRSGATIATGLLLGVDRQSATQYSFLLSLPAVMGAMILELRTAAFSGSPIPLILGAIVAALSGALALAAIVRIVTHGRLHWFTIYLWLLGGTVLVYSTGMGN